MVGKKRAASMHISNPHNFLLIHAMGPNVAGVLGSAVVAEVLVRGPAIHEIPS
jgi:Na+-transporting methylmalonyl-CoA/oxaloacetate decarboxylase beta subunit